MVRVLAPAVLQQGVHLLVAQLIRQRRSQKLPLERRPQLHYDLLRKHPTKLKHAELQFWNNSFSFVH